MKNTTTKSCDFSKGGTKGSRTGSVLEPFLVAAFDKFPKCTVLSIAQLSDDLNLTPKKGHHCHHSILDLRTQYATYFIYKKVTYNIGTEILMLH